MTRADNPTWYVVVRPDNGYPVLVYGGPDGEETAHLAADNNGYKVVAVRPVNELERKAR